MIKEKKGKVLFSKVRMPYKKNIVDTVTDFLKLDDSSNCEGLMSYTELALYKCSLLLFYFDRGWRGGEGRGYSQKNWMGVCGRLPKTLTLSSMTKICDIPYPIYDLTKTSKPYL